MTTATVATAITTSERCDRCPATPKLLARKVDGSGLEIFMCNHHANQHSLALREQGFVLLAVTHTSEV